MAAINAKNLYGTVDLLVLKMLGLGGPKHGLAIADEIRAASGDRLIIEEGALYPALHRLQQAGLIEGEWRISDKRRRAKFYDITPAGNKELHRALQEWTNHTRAVRMVLDVAWGDLR